MKRFLILFSIALLGLGSSVPAQTNSAFASGLAALKAGDCAIAADQFRQIAAQSPSTGAFLNLGLAEWQRGHAGTAILAWERARWINPFARQASQNLTFARQAAQVDDPPFRWFEAVSLWLPPNAWVWFTGASLWLALGVLILPRIFRRQRAGWQHWLAALGLGLFLFGLTANLGVVSRTNLGFVLKRDAPLLLTPTHTGEVITTLPAGEPVRRLKAHGDFWLVDTPYGTGWMTQNQIGFVAGH